MFRKIIVIGAGMMGASLLHSIKKRKLSERQVALVKKESQIKELAEKGIEASADYDEAKDADLIIICSNLSSYETIIQKLNPVVGEKTIVSDIGSVKEFPENLFKQKFKHPENFVATHPIAGSDKSGLGVIIDHLYENKPLLITSQKNLQAEIVAKFWRDIGMQVKYLETKKHDLIYAEISHFTQYLAFSLAKDLGTEKLKNLNSTKEHALLKTLRLCNSNPSIWQEIFTYNQQPLEQVKKQFLEIKAASETLSSNDITKIQNRFAHLKQNLEDVKSCFEPEIARLIFYYLKAIENSQALDYAGTGFKDFIQYFLFFPAEKMLQN